MFFFQEPILKFWLQIVVKAGAINFDALHQLLYLFACLCSPIEQVKFNPKFKQNQNFRLIDNLVLQATCQIVRLSKRTTTCLRTFLPYNFGFHVVTVNMPRYAQLVMGPAGSGKVSFLWVSNYRPKRAWGFCFHFGTMLCRVREIWDRS